MKHFKSIIATSIFSFSTSLHAGELDLILLYHENMPGIAQAKKAIVTANKGSETEQQKIMPSDTYAYYSFENHTPYSITVDGESLPASHGSFKRRTWSKFDLESHLVDMKPENESLRLFSAQYIGIFNEIQSGLVAPGTEAKQWDFMTKDDALKELLPFSLDDTESKELWIADQAKRITSASMILESVSKEERRIKEWLEKIVVTPENSIFVFSSPDMDVIEAVRG